MTSSIFRSQNSSKWVCSIPWAQNQEPQFNFSWGIQVSFQYNPNFLHFSLGLVNIQAILGLWEKRNYTNNLRTKKTTKKNFFPGETLTRWPFLLFPCYLLTSLSWKIGKIKALQEILLWVLCGHMYLFWCIRFTTHQFSQSPNFLNFGCLINEYISIINVDGINDYSEHFIINIQ